AGSLERAILNAIEKVALHRELDRHRADLQRSNRELLRFASVVAHDLQNPLATVMTLLRALRRDLEDGRTGEAVLTRVDDVLGASSRMTELIRELLEFSRIGGAARQVQPVSMPDLLQEVADGLRALREADGGEVSWGSLPVVHGDPAQLRQVLQNLIGNGLKYRADAPPQVRVDCVEQQDAWRFTVSDNGAGIDPSEHQRVFDAFVRLPESAHLPGTGLGLAICKKVVEHHGGQIGVESRRGEGTTVWFTLPK
ncbi:MAG: hypothetical protein KDC87_16935, partial [Planctomycetes bacterium]|nr:hypothetical protein [Planctomycetota bacterium]